MKIIFSSNNQNKIDEISSMNLGFELLTLKKVGIDVEDIPETADTFEGNAMMKAEYIYKITGEIVVADDSGIEVRALNNEPGIYSRRWSKMAGLTGPEDETNNKYLLERLAHLYDRAARYRCVIAVKSAKYEGFAEGTCKGKIVFEPRGSMGFAYDCLFSPEQYPDRTFAEISMEEKNAISHRGIAIQKLNKILTEKF